MNQATITSQATKQATQQQSQLVVTSQQPSKLRPPVKPVYGICGHVARSSKHTCGAWSCLQMWGW